MDKVWQDLLNVLADLLSAYKKMLELGIAKREALVSAKVKDIEDITKQEESLIIFVTRSEKVRAEALEKIAAHYQLTPEEVSISKIKQFASTEIETQIKVIEHDFQDVLSKLQVLNQTNNELIQQALNFVNYNINILTQNVANLNYAPKGQQERSQAKAVFDAKI